MEILIIGTGYVGLTTGLALASKGHKVTMLDTDEDKIEKLNNGESPFFENGINDFIKKYSKNTVYTTNQKVLKSSNIIFVAVPTPEKEDGSTELKYVDSVIKSIKENSDKNSEKKLFIIKSTVPVGTNRIIQKLIYEEKLNIEVASNPEFLSQGTALKDSLNPSRFILGSQSKWAEEKLLEIFKGFDSPKVVMSLESAEMVKYASNVFQALKISYVNELSKFTEKNGADIGEVAEGMGYDPIIGNKFLRAGVGYGGSCFPKDTKSLAAQAKRMNINAPIVNAVIETNEEQAARMLDKVLEFQGSIGLMGLSFKPGTDDAREAPAMHIIKKLNKIGITPYAFCPHGEATLFKLYPNLKVNIVKSSSELINFSENIMLLTEWDEFKELRESDFKGRRVFDGRRIYPWAYYQIGRN